MDYHVTDIGAGVSQSTVIAKNPEGAPKGNTNARTRGLNTLKDAVTKLGSRALDGRSSLSYALKKWRRELVEDLGGQDNISTQQSALIDLAVKSKLIIDSIDAWLLAQPREVYMVWGRRSGKSFISSLVATYLACFSNYARHLNAGERAVILVLARDRDQGRVCFSYVAGIIREIAPLAAMVVSERADEIELSNGTVIMVKTSDFRSVRGLTLAAVICDEVAFWDSQGVSPDTEIFRALKPAMATIPDSKLIAISSPYAMSGVLYEAHRDFSARTTATCLSGNQRPRP